MTVFVHVPMEGIQILHRIHGFCMWMKLPCNETPCMTEASTVQSPPNIRGGYVPEIPANVKNPRIFAPRCSQALQHISLSTSHFSLPYEVRIGLTALPCPVQGRHFRFFLGRQRLFSEQSEPNQSFFF